LTFLENPYAYAYGGLNARVGLFLDGMITVRDLEYSANRIAKELAHNLRESRDRSDPNPIGDC
jgi:hypothetical protein